MRRLFLGVLMALVGFLQGQTPSERPTVLVVAGLNPDHGLGVRVAERLPAAVEKLAATDAELRAAMERVALWVVPTLVADQQASADAAPLRDLRVNQTPVDDDNDGLVDEDGPEDLDGDGIIATMRWPDPEGRLMPSKEDPRLMVMADASKGERGMWSSTTEGIDNDGDGLINEDGPGGVDLDRNFAHGWKERERAAGLSAPSEPATRKLLQQVLDHGRVAAVYVLGHRDNIATTWRTNDAAGGRAPNGVLRDDVSWSHALSEEMKGILEANDGADDWPDGGFHHWAYGQYGVPAFASRVAYRPELPADAKFAGGAAPSTSEGRWLWIADQRKNGFIPWKRIDHPTLGSVEVGGFVPRFAQTVAQERFEAIVAAQARAVAALIKALPELQVATIHSRSLGAGVFEVEVELTTRGQVPLFTASARKTRVVRPVLLELSIKNGTLLQGSERQLVDDLGPNGRKKFSWLLRCSGTLEVSVSAGSPRTGSASASLRVEGN